MTKKIFALLLAVMMLACFVACDEDTQKQPSADPNEIDVSTGGFFDDVNTNTSTETVDTENSNTENTEEIIETDAAAVDTEEIADTANAEAAE